MYKVDHFSMNIFYDSTIDNSYALFDVWPTRRNWWSIFILLLSKWLQRIFSWSQDAILILTGHHSAAEKYKNGFEYEKIRLLRMKIDEGLKLFGGWIHSSLTFSRQSEFINIKSNNFYKIWQRLIFINLISRQLFFAKLICWKNSSWSMTSPIYCKFSTFAPKPHICE